MAKYPHLPETRTALEDIKNRLQQLIEANQRFESKHKELVKQQNQALYAALTVVQQVIDTGHVFRGSSAVPDEILPYVKTPAPQERLGV